MPADAGPLLLLLMLLMLLLLLPTAAAPRRRAGKGGTGDTWHFKDMKNGRDVAVKFIKRPLPKVLQTNILREFTGREGWLTDGQGAGGGWGPPPGEQLWLWAWAGSGWCPCGAEQACLEAAGPVRQAAAGAAAGGPSVCMSLHVAVAYFSSSPACLPCSPASGSAPALPHNPQIQADLGFGHSNVIKAFEAVLTPSHLCLGGGGVGKWGWLQRWRQGQG